MLTFVHHSIYIWILQFVIRNLSEFYSVYSQHFVRILDKMFPDQMLLHCLTFISLFSSIQPQG